MANGSFENETFGFVPSTHDDFMEIDIPVKYAATARVLAASYGWKLFVNEVSGEEDIQFADVIIQMVDEVCRNRFTQMQSLRYSSDLNIPWQEQPELKTRRCILMGRTSVTESLERHLMLLDFNSRIEEDFSRMAFSSNDIVIVSGEGPRYLDIVANALFARSPHVAAIGNRDRAVEVVKHLNRSPEKLAKEPLYLPAGVDIQARNHDEIALSIVAEILLRGTI